MKKHIALVLALALLFVPLNACGTQQPDPSGSGMPQPSSEVPDKELSEVTHRLLADWYGYIARCEYLYGDMLWVLSYLEPFFEDHSWDSLQTARAALYLAQRRTQLIEPPQSAQMSFDDYDMLIQSGADVGSVQLMVDGISSEKSAVLLDYEIYQSSLDSPAEELFLTYQLAHFADWAGLIRQIYELHLRSCALETDYVLLAVDNQEEEARFLEAITEKCPLIHAQRANSPQGQDALLKEQSAVLDELEQLTNELSANVGQSQASLGLFKDALNVDASGGMDKLSQYISAMSADAVELTGFPSALPYPNWWYTQEAEDVLYTWENGEDGKKTSLMPGDSIEAPPDQCYIAWPDVSLEEYYAYLESLEGYGIHAQFVTEKEESYTAFFELQTGSFTFIWEENKVSFLTLDGSVCFAPPWYVIYGLQADA